MEQTNSPLTPALCATPTSPTNPTPGTEQKEVLKYFLEYMKLMNGVGFPNSGSTQWSGNSQPPTGISGNYVENTSGHYGNQSGGSYSAGSDGLNNMYASQSHTYGITQIQQVNEATNNEVGHSFMKQTSNAAPTSIVNTFIQKKQSPEIPKVKPRAPARPRNPSAPKDSVKKKRGGYRMYSLAFKLAAVNYAIEHSRMAASKKFGVKYELIRMWCTQKEQLEESANKPNGKSRTRVCQVGGKPKRQAPDSIDMVNAGLVPMNSGPLNSSSQSMSEDPASLQANSSGSSQNTQASSTKESPSLSTEEKLQKTRKQCSYSIKFKLEVIEHFEKSGNKSATSRKFGVDTKRVRDWHRDKDKLKQRLQDHFDQVPWEKEPVRLAGSGRKIISPSLEIRIVSWIKELQRLDVRMSGQMICDKAIEYFKADENIQRELEATHFEGFAASSGWLRSFLRRQNISLNHVLREEDIPEEAQQLVSHDNANGSGGPSLEPSTEQIPQNTLANFPTDLVLNQYGLPHVAHSQ